MHSKRESAKVKSQARAIDEWIDKRVIIQLQVLK